MKIRNVGFLFAILAAVAITTQAEPCITSGPEWIHTRAYGISTNSLGFGPLIAIPKMRTHSARQ
jgi:hypothetical protein